MLFKELETPRLLLTNISHQDRDFIYSQFSNPIVTRFLYDEEPLTDVAGADEIIDCYVKPEPKYQHRWILIRKTDGEKLGTCGFHCWYQLKGEVEVGYDLADQYWGKGYMTEALTEIVKFAQVVMNVKKINACIYTENTDSIRLVEKLGFKRTGTKVENFRGNEYQHYIYTKEC